MAIAITALQSLSDISDLSLYSSASYTPTANRLLIAYIGTVKASALADPNTIQILTLSSVGYTNCVAADIGKMVTDDGGNTGNLLDFNNTTRTWYINYGSTIADGSVMAITTGTGAGTASGASVAGEGVTGNGVTWTQKAFQNDIGATPTMRIMVYTAFSGASPVAGVMKTTYAAGQVGQMMSIVEVSGADMTGTPNAAIVQAPKNAVAAATSLSITIAAISGGLNRFMSGFIHLANEVTTPRALVAGTSLAWTEVHDANFATPATGFETQKLETDQELGASASWATSSVNAGIALEIKANFVVTTDLITIANAETVTGWTQIGTASGNPNGAMVVEADFFVQGTQCISRGTNLASVLKGMAFDIGAGNTLNFGQGGAAYGKLIYIWMRFTTQSIMETRALGGLQIVVGSGASAPAITANAWSGGVLSAFYVSGGDVIAAADGWVCYVIDPTLPPSTTFGGGCDLTAARWFGGVVLTNTGTAKGQTFGIDSVRYGLGEILCSGTPDAGRGIKWMADADFTAYNKWGLLTEKAGVFLAKGKIVVGDGVATAATTFTSQEEIVLWEHPTYYDGTRERPAVRNLNPSTGLPYFGLDVRGNGTGNTNVTLGVKVGSGDTASGRSGPSFLGSRVKAAFDLDDGAVENVLVYGSTFRDIRGGIDLSANAATDEFIGNTVVKCGSVAAGPVEIRGCNFIDNLGGAYRATEDFKNDGTAIQQLSTADPSHDWISRLNGAAWSVPVGAEYVELINPGGADARQVAQLNSPDTGAAALTINVVAAAGTFTRTTGSYLTDGFYIGQTVTSSGLTGGNNATKVIKSLTATILTVTDTTGLANETGNNDERILAEPHETNNSGDHYAEAKINWPSAGSAQGSLGVCIRMSNGSGNNEDYYYLKCDLVAQTITLVRCDNGTDATVDGPDAYTFAEDTDYLIQLIGRGTLIEGFVNGQKVTVTSATYQANTRVGVRGDAKTAQTGDAPRLSRFGCGPITDSLGALVLTSATDDAGYNNFINNARATGLLATGTYTYNTNTFSGNLVELRDDSSGATTVNVDAAGGVPTVLEEVDDAVTTVNSTRTYTLTNLISGSEVRIFRVSDSVELDGVESSGTSFIYSYSYTGDVDVYVIIQKTIYEWIKFTDTITSSSKSQKVFQRIDRNYANPS